METLVLFRLFPLSTLSSVNSSCWKSFLLIITLDSWLSSNMVNYNSFFYLLDEPIDASQKRNCFWRLLFSRCVTWANYIGNLCHKSCISLVLVIFSPKTIFFDLKKKHFQNFDRKKRFPIHSRPNRQIKVKFGSIFTKEGNFRILPKNPKSSLFFDSRDYV